DLVRIDRTVSGEVESPHFRVTRLTLSGDTVYSRQFPYTPRPIDSAVVDSLIRLRGEAMTRLPPSFAGAPTPARAEELARQSLYLPAHLPPVSQVVPGRDGSLWLKREELPTDSSEWLVLDPGGEVVGTVFTPRSLTVQLAEAGRIW